MALEDITGDGPITTVEFLASTTTANGTPSGTSAGIDVALLVDRGSPSKVSFLLKSTDGSGYMSATIRMWGYHSAIGDWVPTGTGCATSKGRLNAGQAIHECDTDRIAHAELLDAPLHFARLYCELVDITGTSTAVTGYLSWTDRD